MYRHEDDEYLQSEFVRKCFIGDHLGYDVENCRVIIVPVLINNKWSCYCWDFLMRVITVLDPNTMSGKMDVVCENHTSTVDILHHGMLSCIDSFFYGWEVRDQWERRYPCGTTRHCKRLFLCCTHT